MKTYPKFRNVLAIGFLLVAASSAQTISQSEWTLKPRTLPVPNGVSDVFKTSLEATPQPDVNAMHSLVLKTEDEWKALIALRDKPATENAKKLAKEFSVEITEDRIAGVAVHRVDPPEVDARHEGHLFIYIHGGAWVLNGGIAGTTEATLIASRLKIPVISIDYRMPPDYPAPAATDDVIAVWKEVIKKHKPSAIAMGGSSGGANITMSSIHRFKAIGLSLPGALYLGTPAVDLQMEGDTRFLNEGVDRLLVSWNYVPSDAAKMYAGKLDIRNPFVAPIHGDFSEFPPSYLISGTRDILLSDTVRAHRKLRRAGVEADLHVYEGQSHGDYAFVYNAPESLEHYAELNRFLLKHLTK